MAARIKRKAGEDFAELIAEEMMLDVKSIGGCAEPLVTGEHWTRLFAGEYEGSGGA